MPDDQPIAASGTTPASGTTAASPTASTAASSTVPTAGAPAAELSAPTDAAAPGNPDGAQKQQKKQKQQKQQQKPQDGQGDQPRPPKQPKQPKEPKPPADQATGEAAPGKASPPADDAANAAKDAAAAKDAKDKDVDSAKESAKDGAKDGAKDAPAATGLIGKLRDMIAGKIAMAREIRALPWVTISTGREPTGREIYRFLSSNHLTWTFIPSKCLGVALLKLPADHATYLAGKSRQALRTNITRTKKAGFTCRMFDPVERFAQMLAIFHSTPERQGHAVNFQAGPFAQMMADRPERFYGIFDKDDVLKGFACPTITGEMGWTRVFIGHNDDLRTGIMYALMSYLIQELIAERDRRGQPLWLMYDFWYGKSEGMRYFIQLCGFTPHNVHWRQAHIAPERRAPTDDWQRWECG